MNHVLIMCWVLLTDITPVTKLGHQHNSKTSQLTLQSMNLKYEFVIQDMDNLVLI